VPKHPDAACVLLLVLLTAVGQWPMVVGGTVVGVDSSTFFYPMYSFLGERLRAGDVPGWNPHQFAGAPFAADPQSGWMYLPAMVLFTFLPLAAAAGGYLVFHVLVAGLAVYALGRALGLRAAAALVAAAVYELNAYTHHYNVRCFACSGVFTWLPVALLAAEMALRSRGWLQRIAWWWCAGFALSQVLASWLGQGSYYALLTLGAYIAYRTLISPPTSVEPGGPYARLTALGVHGGAMLLFGFGLAAAGLLPRLEYNALSTLAGGYPESSTLVNTSGWSMADWAELLHQNAGHYVGGATAVLAMLAPFVARRRHATPFFAGLAMCALVLTSQGPTPLHSLLYLLLPGFDRLHPHYPERVMMVFFLAPAILAGASVHSLWERRSRTPLMLLALAVPLALLWAVPRVAPATIVVALVVTGLWLWGWLSKERRSLAAVLLILVLVSDLVAAERLYTAQTKTQWHYLALRKVDLSTYYQPTPAAAYLLSMQERGPFRYFGYDPANPDDQKSPPLEWMLPRARNIVLQNRATSLGLQDVQGYNPVQVARYREYMDALNAMPQVYRRVYVLSRGLGSTMLDLLNVRYMVVPADSGAEPEGIPRRYTVQHADEGALVLRRPGAYPRAWLVHSARQVGRGEALALLASGAVNPGQTALLEGAPPPLAQPERGRMDKVSLTRYEPDRMALRVDASAPGVLMLSEVYYPAWKAYVDGKPARLYAADHVLRAVGVPAGAHEVELRYESWTLRLGLVISAAFYAVLAVVAAIWALRMGRRARKQDA
jgi:hypothetical protein